MEVPTLTTDRLILRPMAMDDWPTYRSVMMSDHARFMGGPFPQAAAWGMFCSDHAQWGWFGCGALMMESRGDGTCFGQVGINGGPLFPEWELGWMLWPSAEGKGLAFEAARALRDWGLHRRRLPALVSYVDPDNSRSCRLAERLGATLDPAAARPDPADLVYRHAP